MQESDTVSDPVNGMNRLQVGRALEPPLSDLLALGTSQYQLVGRPKSTWTHAFTPRAE